MLATSRHAPLYNAEMARELRDVIGTLKTEIEHNQPSTFSRRQSKSF
jgi:hypothetical protein